MQDPRHERWLAILKVHHIVSDAASLRTMISELVAHLQGTQSSPPNPAPYRDHVTAVYARADAEAATAFFRSRLAAIEEPSAPFGFEATLGSDAGFDEVTEELGPALTQEIRRQARRYGVSVATFFHAAWGLVVARTSDSPTQSLGSVLLGRMAGDVAAKNTVGMFINTLPLRLTVESLTARQLHRDDAARADRAPRSRAGLHWPTPSVAAESTQPGRSSPRCWNYRHEIEDRKRAGRASVGVRVLTSTERTNYPIAALRR